MLCLGAFENNKLAGRYEPDCNGAGTADSSGSIDNVIACFNYLVAIGREVCPEASATKGIPFCTAGDAQVYATNTQKSALLVPAPPIAASAWCV